MPEPESGVAAETAQETDRRSIQKELLFYSILALFCELLVIRWLSTEIRVFAYFKNLPLMSAFLGLGLGFIWHDRKWQLQKWSGYGLMLLCGLLILAFNLGFTYMSFVRPEDWLMFGLRMYSEGNQAYIEGAKALVVMVSVFVLTTSLFVGFGQRMGQLFEKLRPLEAYSINVFGSLLGTLTFTLLSFLSLSPAYWMGTASILLFLSRLRGPAIGLAMVAITYFAFLNPHVTQMAYGENFVKTIWSPYYRIDVAKETVKVPPYKGQVLGYNVRINYDYFQAITDNTQDNLKNFPKELQKTMLEVHSTPFMFRKPKNVLVLGSGSGSDVAAALRHGAEHVDAVEIDPCIAQLGKTLHPEKPYLSDKVTVYVTDARYYLKNCKKKYDVIVFAALDSHSAFSSLSSLRMDNYVFTVDSLKEAANLLTTDGVLAVSFAINAPWLWDRHAKAVSLATGTIPLGWKQNDRLWGVLIAGPGQEAARTLPEALLNSCVATKVDVNTPIAVSTDDWPFLFLPKRELPSLYILPIIAFLLLSAIPVAREFKRGAGNVLNWQMFILGMAFMLLEVRAMADMSLLFGSTWIVNSVIISGVMVVILIANWVATKVDARHVYPLGAAVIGTLLISTFVHVSNLAGMGPVMGGTVGTTVFLLPLVFASTLFALLYKRTETPSTTLAFNLIGGVVGVCLEYLSMWLGIKALGWIGILLYATVLVLNIYKKKTCAAG